MRIAQYRLLVGRIGGADEWRSSIVTVTATYRKRTNRQILRLAINGGAVPQDAVSVQIIGIREGERANG